MRNKEGAARKKGWCQKTTTPACPYPGTLEIQVYGYPYHKPRLLTDRRGVNFVVECFRKHAQKRRQTEKEHFSLLELKKAPREIKNKCPAK